MNEERIGQTQYDAYGPRPAGSPPRTEPPKDSVLHPDNLAKLKVAGTTPSRHPSQAAKHSMLKVEHYTPLWLIEGAREVLEWIDLDPASDSFGNTRVGAKAYYTKDDDSLNKPWHGRVFLNPPGGKAPGTNKSLPGLFWAHLMEWHTVWFNSFSRHQQGVSSFFWVGFSVEQLAVLQKYSDLSPLDFSVCVFKDRTDFDDADGKPQGSPTHANYVCYAGTRRTAFEGVFSKHGKVMIR